MRKFLSVIIGMPLLAAGAFTLWIALGPQPTEARTTGGVLYTQQEIALQSQASPGAGPELGAITDTTAGAQAVPVMPQFNSEVAADLSLAEPAEIGAAPLTTADIGAAPSGIPLTTDLVLDGEIGVAVAPLAEAAGAPVPDGQGGMTTATLGYEQRVVELEWPSEFQVGRSSLVRIKLKVLESGALQPVAEIADNEVVATPILITDRYDTHNAFVTAMLSAPDFAVETVNPPTQSLQRGGDVEWRWTLTANSAQTSIISLGLAITWEPKPGQPPGPTNVAIWGQSLQVEVNHVFGLITVDQASIAGTALAVLGLVAELPLLGPVLGFFFRLLFGRRRRRRNDNRRGRRR